MKEEELAEFLFQQLRANDSVSLVEILNEFNRGEIGVLSYLAFDKDETTAGELSEKLKVTTARIASILNSLENKEYIKRREDQLDKRKTVVVITDKGKKLATDTKKELISKIIKVVKEIGHDEIQEYVRIALKIREVLNSQE